MRVRTPVGDVEVPDSVCCTKAQLREIRFEDKKLKLAFDLAIRWDDQAENGVNTFSVTGKVRRGPDRSSVRLYELVRLYRPEEAVHCRITSLAQRGH
jgi:hypothetical protein